MPVDDNKNSVTDWLGEAYLPDDITDGDEEERIILEVEAWVDAHEQSRKISDPA